MAITTSAVGVQKYVGADSGSGPFTVSFDLAGTATDAGDLDVTHNQNRLADELYYTQYTGTAQLVLWKRTSDTVNKSVITLGTVPGGGTTGILFLRFHGNDSPVVLT